MVYCYFFGVWILPLLQTKLILWIPIDILFIFSSTGYTDRIYRNAFAHYFGGVEVYYTPLSGKKGALRSVISGI
ncbi:MAG: hypothetical protein ACLUN1_11970 [Odoribacter splanchnicus]